MLARSRPDLYGDHGAAQEGVARSLLWERRVLDTHADCLLQVRLVHRCRRRRRQSARPPACLPAYEPPVCTAARYSGLLATLCWHGCGTIETCRGAGVMMWCGVVRTCGCGCPRAWATRAPCTAQVHPAAFTDHVRRCRVRSACKMRAEQNEPLPMHEHHRDTCSTVRGCRSFFHKCWLSWVSNREAERLRVLEHQQAQQPARASPARESPAVQSTNGGAAEGAR